MSTVQIRSKEKYGKAIVLLLKVGGSFRTIHPRKLVIGPYQAQCLRDAGLLPKLKMKRGQKEVRFLPGRAITFVFPRFPLRPARAKQRTKGLAIRRRDVVE